MSAANSKEINLIVSKLLRERSVRCKAICHSCTTIFTVQREITTRGRTQISDKGGQELAVAQCGLNKSEREKPTWVSELSRPIRAPGSFVKCLYRAYQIMNYNGRDRACGKNIGKAADG